MKSIRLLVYAAIGAAVLAAAACVDPDVAQAAPVFTEEIAVPTDGFADLGAAPEIIVVADLAVEHPGRVYIASDRAAQPPTASDLIRSGAPTTPGLARLARDRWRTGRT